MAKKIKVTVEKNEVVPAVVPAQADSKKLTKVELEKEVQRLSEENTTLGEKVDKLSRDNASISTLYEKAMKDNHELSADLQRARDENKQLRDRSISLNKELLQITDNYLDAYTSMRKIYNMPFWQRLKFLVTKSM